MDKTKMKKWIAIGLSMILFFPFDAGFTHAREIEAGNPNPVGGVYEPQIRKNRVLSSNEKSQNKKRIARQSANSSGDDSVYKTILKRGKSSYGYQSLTEPQKEIYDNIDLAMETFAESGSDAKDYETKNFPEDASEYEDEYTIAVVPVNQTEEGSVTVEDLCVAQVVFEHDNPQCYFLKSSFSYNEFDVEEGVVPADLVLYCDASFDEAQTRRAIDEKIGQTMENLQLQLEESSDNYEKVLIIHDFILDAVDYRFQSPNVADDTQMAHSIAGVFDEYGAVCEGYAKTFQFITDYVGIRSVYLTGYSDYSEDDGYSGGHAWNLVSFDDQNYYCMDLTWDDRGSGKEPDKIYTWYAMPKDVFGTRHFSGVSEDPVSLGWSYELPESVMNDMTKTYYAVYRSYIPEQEQPMSESMVKEFLIQAVRSAPAGQGLQLLISTDENNTLRNMIQAVLGVESLPGLSVGSYRNMESLYVKKELADTILKEEESTEEPSSDDEKEGEESETPKTEEPVPTQTPTQVPTQTPVQVATQTPVQVATQTPTQTPTAAPGTTGSTEKKKTLKVSSVKIKKGRKKITGKVSVKGTTIRIRIGKKAFKKATVKGKTFVFSTKKLKKKTKITIRATKKGYKTFTKAYRI